jgi:hypothetical protein
MCSKVRHLFLMTHIDTDQKKAIDLISKTNISKILNLILFRLSDWSEYCF